MIDSKEQKRLSERVFDYIIENILSGSITPNSRVVERKIASELGISHVPVREALEKLEHEGWIERLPQRGARVKEFNEKEIEELFQLRIILECGAVKIIKYPLKNDKKSLLDKAYNAFVDAFGKGDIESAVKADTLFHQAIVKCTDNKKMISVHRTTVLQLRHSFPVFFFGALDLAFGQKLRYEELQLDSHKRIYHALLDGKTSEAYGLIESHISNSSYAIKTVRSIKEKLTVGNFLTLPTDSK